MLVMVAEAISMIQVNLLLPVAGKESDSFVMGSDAAATRHPVGHGVQWRRRNLARRHRS